MLRTISLSRSSNASIHSAVKLSLESYGKRFFMFSVCNSETENSISPAGLWMSETRPPFPPGERQVPLVLLNVTADYQEESPELLGTAD